MVLYISLRFLGKRRVIRLIVRVYRPRPGVRARGRQPSDCRGAMIGIQLMRLEGSDAFGISAPLGWGWKDSSLDQPKHYKWEKRSRHSYDDGEDK